jgi:hypothetical protein
MPTARLRDFVAATACLTEHGGPVRRHSFDLATGVKPDFAAGGSGVVTSNLRAVSKGGDIPDRFRSYPNRPTIRPTRDPAMTEAT